MKTENIAFIRRRFAKMVCPAMGWNPEGDATTPGHAFIEKASAPGRFRAVIVTNAKGGCSDLGDTMTPAELMAWFEGLLLASDYFGKLSQIRNAVKAKG